MRKKHFPPLFTDKGTTIKKIVMNYCCWILLLCIGSIFTACSDEDPVKKNPYLSTSTRAMLKEVVEVKILNIDRNITVHVDFGDGTVKEGIASDVITHQYTKSGDYMMNIISNCSKLILYV